MSSDSDFAIRNASADDLASLMRLEQACFSANEQDTIDTYREKLKHADFLIAVAPDQEVMGHFIVETWPDQWEEVAWRYQLGEHHDSAEGTTLFIASIALHPATRGRGFASRLLTQGLAIVINNRERKVPPPRRAIAAIRSDNDASIRLFERAGFEFRFERTGYFPLDSTISMRFYEMQPIAGASMD